MKEEVFNLVATGFSFSSIANKFLVTLGGLFGDGRIFSFSDLAKEADSSTSTGFKVEGNIFYIRSRKTIEWYFLQHELSLFLTQPSMLIVISHQCLKFKVNLKQPQEGYLVKDRFSPFF